MPLREITFIDKGIYHIYSKTIDQRRIFESVKFRDLFVDIMHYYRSRLAKVRYSVYRNLSVEEKLQKAQDLNMRKYFHLDIFSYVLMPNHFHLLVRQRENGSIQHFMATTLNSFTRYSNLVLNRKGPVFLTQFKAKIIRSDEQLNHVSRYIHLNPYSAGLARSLNDLYKWPHSSYRAYIGSYRDPILFTDFILRNFNQDKKKYKKFVESNAEYQKTLEYCKHVEKWAARKAHDINIRKKLF